MTPRESRHDPILYQFFRLNSGLRSDWPAYLQQLTAIKPAGCRAPRRKPVIPLESTDPYPWAYLAVRVLATHYLTDTTTVANAAKHAEAVYQAVIDAPTPKKRAGAERRLLYSRARWWAAIIRDLPEAERANPAPPPLTNDARRQEQRTFDILKRKQEQRTKKLANTARELEHCREQRTETLRVYTNALMTSRRAQAQHERSMTAARRDGNSNAQAPRSVTQAVRLAALTLKQARLNRDLARRRYLSAKVKHTRATERGT